VKQKNKFGYLIILEVIILLILMLIIRLTTESPSLDIDYIPHLNFDSPFY